MFEGIPKLKATAKLKAKAAAELQARANLNAQAKLELKATAQLKCATWNETLLPHTIMENNTFALKLTPS